MQVGLTIHFGVYQCDQYCVWVQLTRLLPEEKQVLHGKRNRSQMRLSFTPAPPDTGSCTLLPCATRKISIDTKISS